MDTNLDIDALVVGLVWPVAVLVLAYLFRDRLADLVRDVVPRVRSFSIAGFSLDLADVQSQPLVVSGAVDLRHAGTPADVNDSTLRSFYEQMDAPGRMPAVVVDLGSGQEWLTSRLFILSVLLSRMRGLQVVVFIEANGGVRRRLVGTAEPDAIRWRLAAHFPWLEAALAVAEQEQWTSGRVQANPTAPTERLPVSDTLHFRVRIADDAGRIDDGYSAEPAAALLRTFLRETQSTRLEPVVIADPHSPEEWVRLPSVLDVPLFERAEWLTGQSVERLLSGVLGRSSIPWSELRSASEAYRVRLVLEQRDRWIALTDEDRVFSTLIDRQLVVEAVADAWMRSTTTPS
jgi:hypothetical protein